MSVAILFLSLLSPTDAGPTGGARFVESFEWEAPLPSGTTRPEDPVYYVPFHCRQVLHETEDNRVSVFAEVEFRDPRPSFGIRHERYLGADYHLQFSLELHGTRLAAPVTLHYYPYEWEDRSFGFDLLSGDLRQCTRLAF